MFSFLTRKTSSFEQLSSEAAFQYILRQSEQEPVLLFKHSATCGVSSMARRRLNDLNAPGDPRVYELVVQRSRPLSNRVAEFFGIRHQSPQAILIHHGAAVFDTSHGGISADAIRRAAAGHNKSEIQ